MPPRQSATERTFNQLNRQDAQLRLLRSKVGNLSKEVKALKDQRREIHKLLCGTQIPTHKCCVLGKDGKPMTGPHYVSSLAQTREYTVVERVGMLVEQYQALRALALAKVRRGMISAKEAGHAVR